MSSMEELEDIENPNDRIIASEDNEPNLIFGELLQDKLKNCEKIGQHRELGEDVEEASKVALQDLKDLLISNNIAEDKMNSILNNARFLLGINDVFKSDRSR